MPCLEITADKAPADLDAFLKNLSVTFAESIGKTEANCMVVFTKADRIYYSGSSGASFLAKVTSIGHIDNERNANLTKKIGAELEKGLGVSLDRGYFFFNDAKASNIGHMGNTVANWMGLKA